MSNQYIAKNKRTTKASPKGGKGFKNNKQKNQASSHDLNNPLLSSSISLPPLDKLKKLFYFKNPTSLIALFFSLLWIITSIYLYTTSNISTSSYSPSQISSIITGFSLPLIFIWLVSNYFKSSLEPLPQQHHDKNHKHLITSLSSQADKIIADINKQISNLEATSDIALNRIGHLESKFTQQIKELFDVTTDAEKKSFAIAKNLNTERQGLLTISQDLSEYIKQTSLHFIKISTESDKITLEAQQKAEKLNEIIGAQTEKITYYFTTIDHLVDDMDQKLETISQKIEKNIQYTDESLNELCFKIEKHHQNLNNQTTSLTLETDNICQKLDLQGHNIKDLTHKAITVGNEVSSSITLYSTQMVDMSEQSFIDARNYATGFKDQIDHINKKMEETATHAKTHMLATSSEFSEQAEGISQVSSDFFIKFENKFSNILFKMDEKNSQVKDHYKSMEEFSNKFQKHLCDSDEKLKDQHAELLNSISYVAENLDIAVDKLKNQSNILKIDSSEIVENLTEQTAALAEGLSNIKTSSTETTQAVTEMENALTHNFDKVDTKASELFSKWQKSSEIISHQNETSLDKLTHISNELHQMEKETKKVTTQTTDDLERTVKDLQELSAQIVTSSETALITSKKTSRAMHDYNGHFEKMIQNFKKGRASLEKEINHFDDIISTEFNQKFNRLSHQIMEKLQSFAIDINRYIEEDVPDNIWQQYIEGDRSIFIRRLGHYINNDVRKQISKEYNENTEFKNYVHEYTKCFEELIEHISHSPVGNSLSISILSSQSGTIYIALSHISGKFI